MAEQYGFNWDIILDNNPDKLLTESNHIIVSADAWILDRAKKWLNLSACIIENHISNPNVLYSA